MTRVTDSNRRAYNRRWRYAKAVGIPLVPGANKARAPSVLWELPAIAEEALTCCGIPGPALLCCGTWGAITTLPHTCTVCGRQYFEERTAP